MVQTRATAMGRLFGYFSSESPVSETGALAAELQVARARLSGLASELAERDEEMKALKLQLKKTNNDKARLERKLREVTAPEIEAYFARLNA